MYLMFKEKNMALRDERGTVSADTTEITVTYTEGDVSVTTGYAITVTEG